MMTLLSVRGMKHKNKKPVLRDGGGKKTLPLGLAQN